MSVTPAQIHETKAKIIAQGGFFELEDVTVDGFTYSAYKHAPKTLIEILQNSRNHGDLEFQVYQNERYTFNQFYQQVDALAASLQSDYQIAKGDRVAIAMRNNPQWAMAYAAITFIGGVVVPINSWGKTEELEYAITDSRCKLLIADPQRFGLIADDFAKLDVQAIVVGPSEELTAIAGVASFAAVVAAGEGKAVAAPDVQPTDDAVILYTSGSTGFPKGVVHRHIGLCQSLMNMMWLGMLLMELEGGAREFKGGAERETPLVTVPLFHATGLLGSFLMPLQMGYKTVLMYKWDSVEALKLIEAEKVTSFSTVPAIIQDLLSHPDFDKYNTDTLIRASAAGAATPTGLPELIEEKLGKPSRSAGYGMTETLATGSTMSGVIFDYKPNSSGIVSPIVEMRFVDADGNVQPQGVPGEIEMYSITCTPGYFEKPEANAATFDEQRWMKTGDVGMIDEDGFLHITGRIKEIVIRGGENIYPGEIENAAYELDAVQENVVFGIPDQAMGEEMVMVAYPAPGATISADEIRAHLKQRLAGYKVPKYIEISEQPLPRNASEKLHKLKVKEAYIAQMA